MVVFVHSSCTPEPHSYSVFKLLHTELANKHPADRPKRFYWV